MMDQSITLTVAEQRKQTIGNAVREYGKRLFGFIRKRVRSDEDAEDILQDVWYQFSMIVDTEPLEQVSAWLFRVARNRIIDRYRKKDAQLLEDMAYENEDGELVLPEFFFEDSPSPETKQLKEFFWQELFKALDELPEEQRQVFIWNELDELTFREIAGRTGVNEKTLISRKRYAVAHLRKRLESLYHEIINQ